VDIFIRTSDYFVDAISTALQVDEIAPGEYLYKMGAVCRSLFIIASGVAETIKLDALSQQYVVSRRLSFFGVIAIVMPNIYPLFAPQVQGTHIPGNALGQVEFCLDTRYMTSARVASGGESLRVFRLAKEDYVRIVKLYPLDEDIIHQNVAEKSEDEKIETSSTVS